MSSQRTDKLDEIDRLTAAMIDGSLSDADERRLNALLQSDAGACDRHLNQLTLHAHLVGSSRARLPQDFMRDDVPLVLPRAKTTWRPWLAAAVVLLGAMVAIAIVNRPATPPVADAPATFATLASATAAQWAGAAPNAGDRVAAGRLSLAGGSAVLRFDNGATLTLTGPAEVLVHSGTLVELMSGHASARCPESAIGFTVRTDASDFIDLGTEFGVAVNADGSSDVHVFEGVVIARPKASGLVVPVLHREAGRVEPERGDLVSIETDPSRFPGLATVTTPATRPATTLAAPPPISTSSRIVFLGDRATDRETHLLLINQAMEKLARAQGRAETDRPALFNLGVQFPLGFEDADYQTSVTPLRATHAVIEFGTEIAASAAPRSVDAFRRDLVRLLDRLSADGIQIILTTGNPLSSAQSDRQSLLDDYNRVVRELAQERSLRLADVDVRFRHAAPRGAQLVADQNQVPTFDGHREMAAELLSAFGYAGLPVDSTLDLRLLPGVVTRWHVRGKPENDRLTSAAAATLTPDSSWRELTLPQGDDRFLSRLADSSHSITYRDRVRGYATDVYFGKGKILEGVATVTSAEPRNAFLNTGGTVKAVWVNGEPVVTSLGWGGWHAGRHRMPIRLRAGENRIVIEAQGSFFVSVTDRIDWPLP